MWILRFNCDKKWKQPLKSVWFELSLVQNKIKKTGEESEEGICSLSDPVFFVYKFYCELL